MNDVLQTLLVEAQTGSWLRMSKVRGTVSMCLSFIYSRWGSWEIICLVGSICPSIYLFICAVYSIKTMHLS